MPFALSPNGAMSASAPFSIAVTVTAMVPFFSVPYLNGRIARSPILNFVPGAATSPLGAAEASSPGSADGLSLLGSDEAGAEAEGEGESCADAESSPSLQAVSPRPRVVRAAAKTMRPLYVILT